jgi:hypothetical protein
MLLKLERDIAFFNIYRSQRLQHPGHEASDGAESCGARGDY